MLVKTDRGQPPDYFILKKGGKIVGFWCISDVILRSGKGKNERNKAIYLIIGYFNSNILYFL